MKPREQRFEVLIPARLRWDRSWVPASVRNISSRGMMLRITKPPPKGTYVDIEVAGRLVAGRVAWSNGQACGFQLQDRIEVASLRAGRAAVMAAEATGAISRGAPRPTADQIAEQSRRFSSLFQYGLFAAIGLATAGLLASEAYKILAAPLDAIEAKLD
jgi:hypothetical protein